MTNQSLTDFLTSTIRLLRQHHGANAIDDAFKDAMAVVCPSARTKTPAPPSAPAMVATMSLTDMQDIMREFRAMYVGQMSSAEVHWFDTMLAVVNGGRRLLGGQIATVNNITQRLASMSIII